MSAWTFLCTMSLLGSDKLLLIELFYTRVLLKHYLWSHFSHSLSLCSNILVRGSLAWRLVFNLRYHIILTFSMKSRLRRRVMMSTNLHPRSILRLSLVVKLLTIPHTIIMQVNSWWVLLERWVHFNLTLSFTTSSSYCVLISILLLV